MSTPRELVVDSAYAAGWAFVRGMPERVARRQFDALADSVWLRHGKGVDRLEANLRRVLGAAASDEQLKRVAHQGVRSYFRYWCEVFQMTERRTSKLVDRVTGDGDDRIRDAVASGRGMILSLPHMGNWDLAGAWLATTHTRFTTVAERLEPESLFERFVEFRESLGMEVIPLTGGERPPYDVLADRLRAGGSLCLLGDRDLTSTGIEVEFFGARARMPAGPAALAHDTGAVLLPVTISYPDRWHMINRIHPEIAVPTTGTRDEKIRTMTQRVADAFAEGIAEHPQDWHMLQRVWVDDLDKSRLSADTVTV